MSSPFYTPTGNPVAQNRGTSPTIRSEFALIDAGFQKLPSPYDIYADRGKYGTDSSVTGAYVVTVNATINALTEGLTVRFRASHTNTSPQSINVNGQGNVPIKMPDGSDPPVGAILVNQVVELVYAQNVFQLFLQLGSVSYTQDPATIKQYASHNRVINGAMQIVQYSSPTLTAPGVPTYGGPDRIITFITASTCSYIPAQAGQLAGARSNKSFQLTLTTTGATGVTWAQRLPADEVSDLNGKTVTFTALVNQNSGGTVNFTASLLKPGSLDNFASPVAIAAGASTPCANGVTTKVSITVALGAADATNGLQLQLSSQSVAAQSGSSWFTTDWCFNEGSNATIFPDQFPLSDELLRCQRYYWSAPPFAAGVALSTTIASFSFATPTSMRIPPSFVALTTTNRFLLSGGAASITGTWTLDSTTVKGAAASFTRGSGTFTAGQGVLLADNAVISPFALSAEL